MATRWWTKNELLKVRRWQEQGVGPREQARRLGRSYGSVKNFIQRNRFQLYVVGEPYCQYRHDQRLRVIQLVGLGMNQAQMARNMRIAHSKISRIVAELVDRGLLGRAGRKGPYWVTDKWKLDRGDDRIGGA